MHARDAKRSPVGRPRDTAPRARRRAPEELQRRLGNAALARLAGGILPGGRVHPEVESAIARTHGGRPLGAETSAWADRAFGAPMQGVRLHTDSAAQELARSVSARAFTVRRDVFFAAGEYRPHTDDGRRLLAHELAHVVQQHGAPASGPLYATRPDDAYERAADRAARRAVG